MVAFVAIAMSLPLTLAAPASAELPPAQRPWIEQTDICRPLEGNNEAVLRCMSLRFWPAGAETDCIVALARRESGLRVDAKNRRSSAYGIPQALPGKKMRSHGLDWRTSALVQASWMADYVRGRYKTPCGAKVARYRKGWY